MTNPCPCGSGLIISECCQSASIAEMKRLSLDESLHSGRIRWAPIYFEYKTMLNDLILEEQEGYVKTIGREITCTEGCSMCCVEFIGARLEECDAIAMYLYVHPPLMNRFLKNYDIWYDRLASGDNILEKTVAAYRQLFESRSQDDRTATDGLLLEYAKRYVPCPFLEDDRCMIYPIRPFVCSTYSVLSDKKFCDPQGYEQSPTEQVKLKSTRNPLSFHHSYHKDLKGRYILGAMPQMVREIVEQGPPDIEGA